MRGLLGRLHPEVNDEDDGKDDECNECGGYDEECAERAPCISNSAYNAVEAFALGVVGEVFVVRYPELNELVAALGGLHGVRGLHSMTMGNSLAKILQVVGMSALRAAMGHS